MMRRCGRLLWWFGGLIVVCLWMLQPVAGAAAPAEQAGTVPALPHFWTAECVDCPRGFAPHGSNHALRLDGQGRPHVVYGGGHLYHAWRDDAGWHIETVDAAPGVDSLAALSIGGDGVLHVVYLDASRSQYKYARQAGGRWTVMTVAGAYELSPAADIAVDASGQPHLALLGSSEPPNVNLEYGRLVAGEWQFEPVTQTFNMAPISLALDSHGEPLIAYGFGVTIARRVGGIWNAKWSELSGACCNVFQIALAIGPDDYPQVAYINQVGATPAESEAPERIPYLGYARLSGSGWHDESLGQVALSTPGLAVDGAGLPHIGYVANGQQRYAHWDGHKWQTQAVAKSEYDYTDTSLVLDSRARVYMAFGHPTLNYGVQTGAGWKVEAIDRSVTAGSSNSLALDAGGNPHVAYVKEADLGPQYGRTVQYAYRVQDGWVAQTVYTGTVEAVGLALDHNGKPHIAFVEWQSAGSFYEVKYAVWNGSQWLIQTVERAISVYTVALALDAADRARLAYGSDMLRYASEEGLGWNIQTVDSGGGNNALQRISLELDPAQLPSVSYVSLNGGVSELRYAHLTGGAWTIESVTSGPPLDAADLALDAAGAPHIAYCGRGVGLHYASRTATRWDIQEVVPMGERQLCGGLALAVDAGNRPHLAYRFADWTSYRPMADLQYAAWNGTSWTIEIVRDAGPVSDAFYQPVSLVIGSEGEPNIASYELATGDLAYSRRYVCLPEGCYFEFLPAVASAVR